MVVRVGYSQFSSVTQSCLTFCDSMDCSTPVHNQLLEHAVMTFNHLNLCHPLHLLSSIFPSIRVFSKESVLRIRWPKYWSFSISPSNEYSGLISFRIDFDLHAVQWTLKSLLQHHSSEVSILQCSAFLWSNSHIHTWTNGKTIALTIWTFVSKVMSLLSLICCLDWS